MRLLTLFLAFAACNTAKAPAPAPTTAPTPVTPMTDATPASSALLAPLADKVAAWAAKGRPDTIDEDRMFGFEPLADWIAERRAAGKPADLVFVCTHNSRRSQMGQAWARAAAMHLGLEHVRTWSGGTEATAFNPRAVKALSTHGFAIAETGEVLGDHNTVYTLGYADGVADRAFSKTYGDPFNPKEGFAAVMVCSAADAECPFVPGADLRVSVPYLDPKVSDGTPEEAATYLAKSEEIGWEMTWLMTEAAGRATR